MSKIVLVTGGMGVFGEMMSGYPAYRISKTALNSMTKIFASELRGIAVNSVCPGWVRTDMGGRGAARPVEKGADTLILLALDEYQNLSGKFFRDKREIDW